MSSESDQSKCKSGLDSKPLQTRHQGAGPGLKLDNPIAVAAAQGEAAGDQSSVLGLHRPRHGECGQARGAVAGHRTAEVAASGGGDHPVQKRYRHQDRDLLAPQAVHDAAGEAVPPRA